MILNFILLAIGFVFLIFGADYLVRGASSLARKMGVSALAIGLTIVAFGTSAPELVVNIVSVIKHTPDLAIGNILGSNIANILLIMGAAALFTPIILQRGSIWKEIPFSLLAAVLILILGSDLVLNQGAPSMLSRADGITLLFFFIIFLYYIFSIRKQEIPKEEKLLDR